MGSMMRMVVGGLPRGMAVQDVLGLVAPCEAPDLLLVDIPGDDEHAMAIVPLPGGAQQASRLSLRLSQRRLNGQPLWTWVTVLPWR